ncbi:NAD(+)/NADH kinase [uncultured Acetatifactor sp.]|uniref:NAD(+)/NADH kinase n=1 Tax=uncultured Acetatifactor sp. TaxID=1671927 RepID=UPI0025D3056B|nr:NAD(+)/NADH kinase [uncultured Acetatifactor sp.]MCI9230099.1 NAD(+)/NADH kinase [Lachnospiraceae bacterium]
MKHFLIYTNRQKDRELATTKRICDFLRLKGKRVTVMAQGICGSGEDSRQAPWRRAEGGAVWPYQDPGRDGDAERSRQRPEPGSSLEVPADADCMIVLGGDGTVLQAARLTKMLRVPIIGVNLGTLGYMTEVEVPNLEESLERLIAGDYVQESRMMLGGRATFADGRREEGWALNDIVISRSGPLQIIKFNIYVNGQFLNDYSADGVIVTTPTGSTGYNLSAGGPLVEPGARLIVLTPICPHSLNQRSIVLSPEDVIEIQIPARGESGNQNVEANFDGSHVIPLGTGDRLRIVRSEETTEFLKLGQGSFLDVLHRKMKE